MKQLPSIIVALIVFLGVGVFVANAQGYTPLAPLPGTEIDTSATTVNLSSYLSGMFKLLIAVSGALAIFMAIIAGTKYVASGINPIAKSGALEDLQNAFIGLALILSSYLILNTINPKLVSFNLLLAPVSVATEPPPATPATSWDTDGAVRDQLQALGVSINKSTCVTVGQENCTSVFGLGSSAITSLGALKVSCPNCTVVITGGTEYWLHSATTQHRPKNSVVDLRKDTLLDEKIRSGVSLGVQNSCSSLGPAYRLSGAGQGLYVDEDTHWHVCY